MLHYAGSPPRAQVDEMKSYSGPNSAFGWAGVCGVGNPVMLFEKEEACRALRHRLR